MRWYLVVKTIKGRRYHYRQRTWREGKHVRTESVYLGPIGGGRVVAPMPERSATAPVVPEEAIHQLTPFTVHLTGEDRRRYEGDRARQRREDEAIQYGPLKERLKRQQAKLRAAKRATRGIKAVNPFIAQAINKKPTR